MLDDPLLLPVIFEFVTLAHGGRFRFDCLMPVELFVVVLAGGVMVFVAVTPVRRRSN